MAEKIALSVSCQLRVEYDSSHSLPTVLPGARAAPWASHKLTKQPRGLRGVGGESGSYDPPLGHAEHHTPGLKYPTPGLCGPHLSPTSLNCPGYTPLCTPCPTRIGRARQPLGIRVCRAHPCTRGVTGHQEIIAVPLTMGFKGGLGFGVPGARWGWSCPPRIGRAHQPLGVRARRTHRCTRRAQAR